MVRVSENADLDLVGGALRASWEADTSVSDNWASGLPEAGQCAVTALVVQDFFGGSLRRALVGNISHYWNVLDDGTVIDLTKSQFADFQPLDESIRERDYVLSFPDTQKRYQLLRQRVDQFLHHPRTFR